MSTLRPSQQAVIDYDAGQMGVSAVPGAGKTHTLSHLAARLVERLTEAGVAEEQEVLIVTLTNSAVNSFRSRIGKIVQQERGLLPYVGYRVRTLHSLAHDIVRMRPALAGLAEGFDIVDDRTTGTIMRDLSESWVRNHVDDLFDYLTLDFADDPEQLRWKIRKEAPEIVEEIAAEVIRMAKNNQWEPEEIRARMEQAGADWLLARIGIDLYEGYQRSLAYRGSVDFDDLVRLAMRALKADHAFLTRLQERWPYILEDEAQDSSKAQNELLELLSGGRNWVRVGDPNQAIFTTFTTADANLLRNFIKQPGVLDRPLKESGRSSSAIIALANYLVEWSSRAEALPEQLHFALAKQYIVPTAPGDEQQNPEDGQIYVDWKPGENRTPEAEIDRLVKSLKGWLPDHTDWTVAVLVPENSRGFKVAEALREAGIAYEELLRSTSATRSAAGLIQIVFDFLAEPTSSRVLSTLYAEVWYPRTHRHEAADEQEHSPDQVALELRNLKNTEDFLWPGPGGDWLDHPDNVLEPEEIARLRDFREAARRWLTASILPADQVILTISQELFTVASDLALAHKIALVMRGIAQNNPDYRLADLARELRLIASNERRFLGFDDSSSGYEPRKSVVTIATMHAAKGLEWDRVYLMALNNYGFPSAQPTDSYRSERYYVRDSLNLSAEVHAQIMAIMHGQPDTYVEGEASRQARYDTAAERLRLMYVGITRARRDLILMWNMGRFWNEGRQNQPAAALVALYNYWIGEGRHG
ncbi:MAG: ATP-dependent helicase [Anaerolineae bacterium]|nr:ATP-dependent helicase [Anaerolineae bacterium]